MKKEKSAVERAMLAISQIEIAVKTFWGDIYKRMPKPEIGMLGLLLRNQRLDMRMLIHT